MGNELATTTMDDMTLGQMLARSGYFQDAREQAQAVVKVLAGRELGLGPIAAMTGIYVVKGRVTLSANLIAAAIKRSGRYNYRVTRMDDQGCEIVFFEGREQIGVSSFDANDAKNAGLLGGDNWKKFPRNMLFARAMSNGAKWFTPDVFAGPVYTPDELGAKVDSDGEIVEGEVVASAQSRSAPLPQQAPNKHARMVAKIEALRDEGISEHNRADYPDPDFELADYTDEALLDLGNRTKAWLEQVKTAAATESEQADEPGLFDEEEVEA
jgi:hypothetical protein